MRLQVFLKSLIVAGALVVGGASALGQETTTYIYDVKGRVVTTVRSGGPSNGTTTNYTYDPADNRTNVTVSGSPNGSSTDSGSGASVANTIYVVVPLNGYTLIAITR